MTEFDPVDWIDRYVAAGGTFQRLDGDLWYSVRDEHIKAAKPILDELRNVDGYDAVKAVIEDLFARDAADAAAKGVRS
jgi:hypothetical protein